MLFCVLQPEDTVEGSYSVVVMTASTDRVEEKMERNGYIAKYILKKKKKII